MLISFSNENKGYNPGKYHVNILYFHWIYSSKMLKGGNLYYMEGSIEQENVDKIMCRLFYSQNLILINQMLQLGLFS